MTLQQIDKSNSNLRVMAVAAPHWASKAGMSNIYSLNIGEPFSLQNAIRHAASLAYRKIDVWGRSNWATIEGRRNSVVMMHYYAEEINMLSKKLASLQPHLLLIGSMSLSFPGAIGIANCAKMILGKNVFIVIGGKHTTETIYKSGEKIVHHAGSPLSLIHGGKIEPCFDMAVAGDGEEIITTIGNIIGELLQTSRPLSELYKYSDQLRQASGDWIAGWVKHRKITTIESANKTINRADIIPNINLFGLKNNFKVFEADYTAHAYSDSSRGCIYNCYFCSERQSINGKPTGLLFAPKHLYTQFKQIFAYGKNHLRTKNGSIFIEDSIMLNGVNKALNKFCSLLEKGKIKLQFGCQFTIDFLIDSSNIEILRRLRKNGLSYVFFGLETNNELIANQMNKNVNRNLSWLQKVEEAMKIFHRLDIKCGVSVLFGLGETQHDRIRLFDSIKSFRKKYGNPQVTSLNIATQHPLQGKDEGCNYEYVEWGTPVNSPHLQYFHTLFGEASIKYPLKERAIPTVEELKEIKKHYLDLNV